MRRNAELLLTSIISLSLFAGCTNRTVARVDPTPEREEFKEIPVELNRDIDILFVIDNSGSMEEEQTSLVANFNRFINVLNNIDGGLPNVHLGVVSTDVGAGAFNIAGCSGNGDNGTLQSTPRGACETPTGAYIVDLDDGNGGRTQNYSNATLEETFSCIARLGIDGCGFEQPLEAMYRALNGSNQTNSGFLRPDAFLAVVIITDEDDCSTRDTNMFDTSQTTPQDPLGPLSSFRCFEFGVQCEPDSPRSPGPRAECVPRNDSQYMYDINRYVDFLKGLKDDPDNVIVAGIIGNANPVVVGTNEMSNPELLPSCTSASGDADPAVRIQAFLDQFPSRNTVTTICNDNLSDALVLIAELLAEVIGNPCLVGNLDTNPETPEIEAECQVSDVRNPNDDDREETTIPNCADVNEGTYPCWELVPDAACDTTETGLSLFVDRGGANVPSGTYVHVHCRVFD